MRHFLSVCALALAPAIPAEADDLRGRFRTEPGSAGVVLHVAFGPCRDAAERICGVIDRAFDRTGAPQPDYPHLDRRIIWGMEHNGRDRYAGGQLWSHNTGKVLRAKLRHRGDRLRVSGCLGPVCRTETWHRVRSAD